VELQVDMCGVTTYLDPPLVVRPGDRVTVTMGDDLSQMVAEFPWATGPGCSAEGPPFLCFAYPNPFFAPSVTITPRGL
jgi:hypothetical protein